MPRMLPTLSIAGILALTAAPVVLAAEGAQVFKDQCAKCHGETGKADTPVGKALKAPVLAGDAKVAGMSDADLAAAIKGNQKHAGFIKTMKDDDVTAAAAYVKGLASGK